MDEMAYSMDVLVNHERMVYALSIFVDGPCRVAYVGIVLVFYQNSFVGGRTDRCMLIRGELFRNGYRIGK
jgi:hypothetical protein